MGLVDFVRKQLIDILAWTEDDDETLAWRFPTADQEIQQGAQLVVRESQTAVFVHEGRVADVFGPGRHAIRTDNLPVLADLGHWAKGFESPIKSEVYFVSTRLRLDRTWGTPTPIVIRDREFGAVRVRAFGVYAYRVAAPRTFVERVSGTRAAYAAGELEGQLRAILLEALATRLGVGGVPFLDLASHQPALAEAVRAQAAPGFEALGLGLDDVRIASVSLPEPLEERLDERIGMGMVGDLDRYTRFQAARSIPAAAESGGVAGAGVGMGVGMAMGSTMGEAVTRAVRTPGGEGSSAPAGDAHAAPAGATTGAVACARCGAPSAADARFCARCGAPR